MALTKTQISELYVSIFNRASEKSGSQNWLNSGYNTDATTMANAMLATDAAKTYFGTSLLTDKAFVDHIYKNTLNKGEGVDEAGKAGWVEFLATGASRGEMVAKMIEAIKEYQVGGAKYATADQTTKDAAQQFANRVKVSDYTADTLETIAVSEIDSKLSFSSALTVTANPATVETAKKSVQALTIDGKTFTLTTSADTFVGTAGNDTVTGTVAATGTTYTNADVIIDQSSTDNDTLNLTTNAAITFGTVSGIENVNITTAMTGALAQSAANLSGVKVLTITRDDMASGSIDGAGTVQITNVDASKVAQITAGAQVTALDVNYSGAATQKAGIVVDASGVTGQVTVDGSATITANDSTSTVAIDGAVGAAAEDAKASSIIANKAATVTTHAGLTGAISIEAAKATSVIVNNAAGGATVNAATAATAGATINVIGIDASGAAITTGTGAATTTTITVNLDGTTGTSDVATVNAAGVIALDVSKTTAAVDTLNLTATTAAATYTVAASNGGFTTIAASGTNAVNVKTTGDLLDKKTVSGVNELTVTAADAGLDNALDLTNVSASTIILAADNANDAITVASGATVKVTAASQNTGLQLVAATDDATLTLVAGDNTPGSTQSTTTLNAVDLNGATNDFATVSIIAEESRFTAASFDADDAAVTITGDENVTLGTTVVAGSIDASGLTGVLSLTATGVSSVTSGTGADKITVNNAGKVVTVNAGNGTNTLTINNAGAGSTFLTGTGNDILNLSSVLANGAFVVQGGAGNDTYNLTIDADVVIADESGTDSIVVSNGITNLTDNPNFAFSGIETLDISAVDATLSMNFDDLSGKTLVVTAAGGNDVLLAVGTDTAAETIDFSGITTTTGATLTIDGGDKADTLIGSNSGTNFILNTGDFDAGETITGGSGTDTITLVTAVADLTVGTITGVEILATNGHSTTIAQGTGITTVTGYVDATSDTFIITKSTTAFATLAGDSASVDVAGEYFFADSAVSGTDTLVTYFDEIAGEAVTITLVGTGTSDTNTNDGVSIVAGNLVVEIA